MKSWRSIMMLVASVTCFIFIWGDSAASLARPLTHVKIETPNAPGLAQQLLEGGFDVLEGSITQNWFELIVTGSELEMLTREGFELQIIAAGRPFRQIQTEQLTTMSVPTGYLELSEILAEMNDAEENYPSICKVVDLTETYGMPTTFEGRHIFAIKISDNVAENEDEPAYLVVCEHHAREIVTPVIGLYAIEQFTSQYGIDPTITALVDEYEIWIAPAWNPDGYEYVFNVDNLWRKNRRVFQEGVGVDQNRNYPFGWDSVCGGSTLVTSLTYRGPEVASEPETQTMLVWSQDRRFAKVLDFHSFGQETLYSYACLPHPFTNFWEEEAVGISIASGYGDSVRLPTAEGEHFEWQLAMMGAHAFLTETHWMFQPLYFSALNEAALVFPSLLWQLQRPIPLGGRVTDAFTGQPVAAAITYLDIGFENGETNGSDEHFGRYHIFLPDGTYNLEFSATSYHARTCVVDIVASSAGVLDVTLVPMADIDEDNDVDMADFAIFSSTWLSDPNRIQWNPACDISIPADNFIDIQDLAKFVTYWLAGI